jgi:hypothetical protein
MMAPMPSTPAPLHLRLRIAGIAIFAVGLIAAALIYVTAPEVDQDEVAYQEMATKQVERQIEMNGGKSLVMAAQFTHWFGGLWRGRNLAASAAFVSVLAALLCAVLARHARAVQEEEEAEADADAEAKAQAEAKDKAEAKAPRGAGGLEKGT